MTDHAKVAEEIFLKGYNCSQSVAAAFAQELGLPEDQVLRMSAGFGAGFGRLREVCGTFSGIVFVISALYGNDDPKEKSAFYARIQALAEQFQKRNGTDTIICRELLGEAGKDHSPNAQERTPEFYRKRPCLKLIREAAAITEDYIREHPLPDRA